MPGGSTLTPRIDTNYQSKTLFSATDLANPFFVQPSYWIENARLKWRSGEETSWQAALGVTNLGNTTYYTGRFDSRTGFGYATSTFAAPRQWYFSVKKSFGIK